MNPQIEQIVKEIEVILGDRLLQLCNAKDAEWKARVEGLETEITRLRSEKYRVADRLCEYFGLDKDTKWNDDAADLLIKKHEAKVEEERREQKIRDAKIVEAFCVDFTGVTDDSLFRVSSARNQIRDKILSDDGKIDDLVNQLSVQPDDLNK